MKNKFAAACASCGQTVAPGAGDTTKIDGKWVTKHLTCTGGAAQSAPAPRPPRAALASPTDRFYEGSSGMSLDDISFDGYELTNAEFNPDEGDR